MADSFSSIPTLVGSNYKQWSDAILAVILRKSDVGVLLGTVPQPQLDTSQSNKVEVEQWKSHAQTAAGYILGSLSEEAKVYITDRINGPQMWKELKDAYDQQTSSIRFNTLQSLLSTNQQPGESLSSFMARVNSKWNDFIAAQSSGLTIDTLNQEVFCLALIRGLDPAEHDSLRHSLIKETSITKAKAVEQIKAVENGLFTSKPSDSALMATSFTPKPNNTTVATPCEWCISKGRSETAKTHVLAKCTGLAASIQFNSQRAQQPKSKFKPKQQAKEAVEQAQATMEFAGTASSLTTSLSTLSDDSWIPDSGATSCMTGNKHWLCNMRPYKVPIRLGDNSIIESEGVGSVWFEPLLDKSYGPPVCFSWVLYVPQLKSNLLSTTFLTTQRAFKLVQEGYLMEFWKKGNLVFTANITPKRVGHLNGRTLPAITVPEQAFSSIHYAHDLELWHKRFGHRSMDAVEKAIKHSVIGARLESSVRPSCVCVACIAGKQHRDPFPSSTNTATRPMEIVYCDLRGPFPVQTHSGKVYWAIFTDLYSRYRKLALLRTKDSHELLEHYKQFEAQAKARFGQDNSVVTFRCDGGGEFIGALKTYLISQGTEYQQSTRATPQQNGVSERANRDIGEGIVSALVQSGLPDTFWGEAALAFVYTTNHFPTAPVGNKTPYELWYGHKPDVAHLRVWGSRAFVHVQRDQRTKTQSHTKECVFIGYPEDHKAWRFYDPITRKVIISRDVVWDENKFLYPPKIGAQQPPVPTAAQPPIPAPLLRFLDEDDIDAPLPDHAPVDPVAPAEPIAQHAPPVTPPRAQSPPPPPPVRPQRHRYYPKEYWRLDAPLVSHIQPNPPSPSPAPSSAHELAPLTDHSEEAVADSDNDSDDPINMLGMVQDSLLAHAGIGPEFVEFSFQEGLEYAFSSIESDEPTFKAAMKSPDRDKWMSSCMDELNAHIKNGTWKLAELPEGDRAIGSRWVLKIKRTEDGSVERFKARLVAQGFSQRPGWDYFENFAPTIRLAVVRAIFALAAVEDLECESVDITTAFLNGDLEEKIYMKLPDGFEQYSPSGKRLYALLCKAIYGLKQGARQWYLKLSEVMQQIGFSKVRNEPCVYIFKCGDDRIMVPCYVDDLHIVCKSKDNAAYIKQELSKHFQIRDLGPTKWFLGMHITRDRSKRTLSLSSHQYCVDMLEELDMADCHPLNTPMAAGLILSKEMCPQTDADKEFMRDKPYQRAVGKLNYLALTTRPDISYTVSRLARYSSNPGPEHWKAVKHVLRYIQGTLDYKLSYGPSPHPTQLSTFSDADFARDTDKGKSTTGWVVLMAGGAVSWCSKLPTRTAQSTTEAEYVAAESARREMAFFQHVLGDLHYQVTLPLPLAMDNQSAIAAAKNPEHQGRMKHMNPIYHGLREAVELKEVAPYYVPTSDMVADILTKPLAVGPVRGFTALLGLSK